MILDGVEIRGLYLSALKIKIDLGFGPLPLA
jgi:hypothetical protein